MTDAAATFSSITRHLPIDAGRYETEPPGLQEIEIAQRHQLTVYDAAYLALAQARGLRLATLDAQLARAANADGLLFAV